MKSSKRAVGLLSGIVLLVASPAWAGVDTVKPSYSNETCMTDKGSLCPPQGASEEVVPEYYNVPTMTKHIYYKKPEVKPIVTHVVHHVPTPVYGGESIVENVQAGPWEGAPAVSCCNRAVQPAPVRPVYAAPPRPVYVAPKPVQYRSPCQARQHQQAQQYQSQHRAHVQHRAPIQHQAPVQHRPCR